MSSSDNERVLRATNVSRAALTVHVYTALTYEFPASALPFRLYLRYYDTPPLFCPCLTAFDAELAGEQWNASCADADVAPDMETGLQLYLAPDHGPQDHAVYSVSPAEMSLPAGAAAQWRVSLAAPGPAPAPDVTLLLRLLPVDDRGPCWQRGEPAPAVVRLREAARAPRLQLSCRELRVRLCALYLPPADVLRVRKRFNVLNVGTGVLELGVETTPPWSVLAGASAGEKEGECGCEARSAPRLPVALLRLQPRSSVEMCVEVCVSAAQAWPEQGVGGAVGAGETHCQTPLYPPRIVTSTPLHIYDDDNILQTLPLLLELEFPVLRATPPDIDLRVVADGETRKCYFTVTHSSRTETLDLATEWIGGKEFKIWPPSLRIPPGGSANVYLQYTAVWQAAPVEGCACVRVCAPCACAAVEGGAAGAWCRACVPVRAATARDAKFHVPCHDHTDEPHLLPPGM